MKKTIVLVFIITVLFSCKQTSKSTQENVDKETVKPTKNIQNDTEVFVNYEYTDSNGKSIIIQNGYPKGGIKYTDTHGNVCSYAVFLTQIINETENPLELNINFPANPNEISNFPGKYFKILVPSDIMTIDKFPSQTELKSFLDSNIEKSSSFIRTINPKESSGLYFVMLISTLEPTGMTRTEVYLKGQELFYKISRYSKTTLIDEKEIHFGSINLKNLTLKK